MTQDVAARAQAIRIARARFRLTQGELAARAGLEQSTISKAENGNASVATYDALDKVIAVLGWGVCEHLPTRKLFVRFDGTNAAEIVSLIDDPRRAWLGELGELIVMFGQGELVPAVGDVVMLDGEDVYPCPADRWERQYRVIADRVSADREPAGAGS